MSNNLMQIYSSGEFSDDYYMQIQASLFHWAWNKQKAEISIHCSLDKDERSLSRSLSFISIRKPSFSYTAQNFSKANFKLSI